MKKLLIGLSVGLNLLFIAGALALWLSLESIVDGFLQSNRERRVTQFEVLTDKPARVVFLGDSITEGGLWDELFPGAAAINRGIGGDTTQDILDRLDQVIALAPKRLFLMIGINDLNRGLGPEVAIANYARLFDRFDKELKDTEIFLQSVLPVNDAWPSTDNTNVPALNAALKREADARGYTFVDLVPAFSDTNGQLRTELSNDGIHLVGAGYATWRDEIQPLVTE